MVIYHGRIRKKSPERQIQVLDADSVSLYGTHENRCFQLVPKEIRLTSLPTLETKKHFSTWNPKQMDGNGDFQPFPM